MIGIAFIAIGFLLLVGMTSRAASTISTGYHVEKLQRVIVKLPLSYVQAVRQSYGENGQKALLQDVENRVEELGFDRTLLTMQDPTDNSLFTLITRQVESISPSNDGLIRIVKMTEVEEPPKIDKIYIQNKDALDSGLSPEEIIAIRQALLEDLNQRHLNGFAQTLEPFFPIAASLLRAKASLLNIRKSIDAKINSKLDHSTQAHIRKVIDISHKKCPSNQNPSREQLLQARKYLDQLSLNRNIPISITRDEIRRVTCLIVNDGKITRFPIEIIQIAKSLLYNVFKSDKSIVRVVCPDRINIVIPPDEIRVSLISPSALQLALAASKPMNSGVLKTENAPKIYESLLTADRKNVQNLKARSQMERASRALERRRWVDWYRRKTLANSNRSRGEV